MQYVETDMQQLQIKQRHEPRDLAAKVRGEGVWGSKRCIGGGCSSKNLLDVQLCAWLSINFHL
jgi:hypothetical protein